MDINDSQIGQQLREGKTKQVFRLNKNSVNHRELNDLVYITNKDNISAGDNSRNRRIMEGKGRITVETSSAIFEYLNAVGIETAFVSKVKNCKKSFIAKHCEMIPIEIVIRRIATGTFIKLNPNVSEGFRFISPEIEIHIKDDDNHDPLWSIEKLIEHKFIINGLLIGPKVIAIIFKISKLVFEILERVWHSIDYQLVDLKVEFGVISDGKPNKTLVLADIIDNETWRLWPNGDKRLMVDKQIYRGYKEGEVDNEILNYVKNVFQKVSNLTQELFSLEKINSDFLKNESVVVLVDSESNNDLAQDFIKQLENYYNIIGVKIISINRLEQNSTEFQEIIDRIGQSCCQIVVMIAEKCSTIRSKIAIPVIDYFDANNSVPQTESTNICLTVAKILAINNLFIWSTVKTNQCFCESII